MILTIALDYIIGIYAEVKVPVASGLRPLVGKTLIASNLVSIMVPSDVDMLYFILCLK